MVIEIIRIGVRVGTLIGIGFCLGIALIGCYRFWGEIGVVGFFVAAALVGCYLYYGGYTKEKRIWNDGVCAKNGNKWQLMSFDEICFGRCYRAGEHVCWVHWDRVDNWGNN